MEAGAWGIHYSLDASGLDYNTITNPYYIKAFIERLVRVIDMVPHGEPVIEYFSEAPCPDKGGYTLSQIIVTSNICCHFVDKPRQAFLDVFSCKEFCSETVEQTFKNFFAADDYKAVGYTRFRIAP